MNANKEECGRTGKTDEPLDNYPVICSCDNGKKCHSMDCKPKGEKFRKAITYFCSRYLETCENCNVEEEFVKKTVIDKLKFLFSDATKKKRKTPMTNNVEKRKSTDSQKTGLNIPECI
jgi:hypothetical protein